MLAETHGLDSTFMPPIRIDLIKAYFSGSLERLDATFTYDGINIHGFNDLDTPGIAPDSMLEWHRYDHHRASFETESMTVDATNLDWFANPITGTLPVRNNQYGRSFTGEYDVYLNPGTGVTTISSSTLRISSNSSFSCQAGTSNGGNGQGTITYSINPTAQYYDGHGVLQSISQDTAYTVVIVVHDLSLYSYTYNGEARENTVKDVDSLTSSLNITTGHPATAANLSATFSDVYVYEASGIGGSLFYFRVTNSGETEGTMNIKVRVQDSVPNDVMTSNTIAVTVPGKTRGGADTYVDDTGNAGYPLSHWAPGMTVYAYYSTNNGSSFSYLSDEIIQNTLPQ
jgi:hypothetical protein